MSNKIILFALILIFNFTQSFSNWEDKGDSVIVTTFTFDSLMVRTGNFQFPPLDHSTYEKIIMEYTLKCDPATTRDNFECGEWDYLTYTFVTDSSGKFDSTELTQPYFKLDNNSPDKLTIKNQATKKHFRYLDSTIVYDAFATDDRAVINEANEVNTYEPNQNRIQFIIKKDEIEFNTPDEFRIDQIYLNPVESIIFNNLKITLKNIDIESFNPNELMPISDGIEVYNYPLNLIKGGPIDYIVFKRPFQWDSSKSILVDMQIDTGSPFKLQNGENDSTLALVGDNNNTFLYFNQGDYIELPSESFENITDEITISFWYKGDPKHQPRNNYNLEALDKNNKRVINVHLPWSNENIYWDCGNDGGSHDRISKKADNLTQYKGDWNYFTFTKNAKTGIMNIYINGELFHSGTDKTRDMTGITKFKLGSSGNATAFCIGSYDDFAIYDKALDESLIKENYENLLSQKEISQSNLLLNYNFEQINQHTINDISENQNNAEMFGLPKAITNSTEGIHSNVSKSTRPQISLSRVDKKETHFETTLREYSETLPETTVYFYDHENLGSVVPKSEIDSITKKQREITEIAHYNINNNGYEYVYNKDNQIIDSIEVGFDEEIQQKTNYWYSPIVRYEIERFITPYGIGLDLGEDGFTWKFDVTHWAPILHDWVKLQSGNTQELLDIKFIMKKGTPARNVINISKLWDENANYSNVVTDKQMSEHKGFKLFDGAESYMVQTRSSGHNFNGPDGTDNCAEFCRREHSLHINSEKLFAWDGWKECGDNPVFPQGGTWLLDRTDWCPGAGVNAYYHEITNFVTPGSTIDIDYDIELPQGTTPYGNWWFRSYMFAYDTNNFNLDAGIYEIISPNIHDEFSRKNPICNGAKFILENNGSETLNSVKIEYGMKGYDKFEYVWTGELEFNHKTEVTLPPMEWTNGWEGDSEHYFQISIIEANDRTDDYVKNNQAFSQFEPTEVFPQLLELRINTNDHSPFGYGPPFSWTITKDDGEVVLNRDKTNHDTEYIEELDLEYGCYALEINSTVGWGLDYQFTRQYTGSGTASIYSGTSLIKVFQPNFGNSIKYQFRVEQQPRILFSETNFDFNNVKIGETYSKELIIKPDNDKLLTITEIDTSLFSTGNKFKGFSITTSKDFVDGKINLLGKEDLLIITINFTPFEEGAEDVSFKISSNSDKNRVQYIDLTSFAYNDNLSQPQALFSTDKLDFGLVKQNTSTEMTLEVKAANDGGLIIDSVIAKKNENFFIKNIEYGTSYSLAKDEKLDINIEFLPTKIASFSDFVYVYSNDESKPKKLIRVSGEGVLKTSVEDENYNNDLISLNIINNPVNNELNIDIINQSGIYSGRIELWNLNGEKIAILSANETIKETYKNTFNISDIETGTYFITLNIGNHRINKKFIKQ